MRSAEYTNTKTRPKGPKKTKRAANLQSSHNEMSKFPTVAVNRDENEISMCSCSSNTIINRPIHAIFYWAEHDNYYTAGMGI